MPIVDALIAMSARTRNSSYILLDTLQQIGPPDIFDRPWYWAITLQQLPVVTISCNSTVHAGFMRSFASIPVTVIAQFMVKQTAIGCVDIPASITEGCIVDKAISNLVAAVAALALSASAYAQGNNTLATPTTRSPAANATSGYGSPGDTSTESGMAPGSQYTHAQTGTNNSPMSATPAFGVNNTLATPSTASPVKSGN